MNDLFVSRRQEIKYLVDAERLAAFASHVSRLLVADVYGGTDGYFNHSIYFDSPDLAFYTEKQEGLRQRVKPRLRAYRTKVDGPPVGLFLELKYRDGPYVAKRRSVVSDALAQQLLDGDMTTALGAINDEDAPGVLSTFSYLARRHHLRPAIAVFYHRTAFSCPHHPSLRVTYDRRLQWSLQWALDNGPAAFEPIIAPSMSLIEIKYNGTPPGWLLDTMAILDLQPMSFSKYTEALEAAQPSFRHLNASA